MNKVNRGIAYTVLQPFKIGPRALKAGDVVSLPEDLALKLINEGRTWPTGMVAMEIFSETLQAPTWRVCINEDRQGRLAQGDVVKAIRPLVGHGLR